MDFPIKYGDFPWQNVSSPGCNGEMTIIQHDSWWYQPQNLPNPGCLLWCPHPPEVNEFADDLDVGQNGRPRGPQILL